MAASALTSAAASVKRDGAAKIALSHAARMTAQGRGCVWKGSACATVTLAETTARNHGALQTARVGACASTASVCVRSPSPVRTAWSAGV